jgi:5-formyltetrahydrofolate cyclo-ligase
MPKNRLRQSILAHRRSLAGDERHAADLRAQRNLLSCPAFAAAATVALYAPVHGEVATEFVMERALARGVRLAYPAVHRGHIEFRAVLSAGDLKPGAYGIAEPGPSCPAVAIDDIDLVVVPGVAFDHRGHRIGYGKGYYDRALHHLEGQGRLAGLCYAFQLVEEIAGEPHDVVMDMIVTDTKVVRLRD